MTYWDKLKADPAKHAEYKERRKRKYLANRTKLRAQGNASYARARQDPRRYGKWKESARKYKATERGLLMHRAKEARRRAKKLQATPPWADQEKISKVYQNCPPGMEVDHIIPLQGKTVCGLHVDYNLQYLTESENCKKSNKLLPPQVGR